MDLGVAFTSALLLWLAFAPIGQFYLAWIALVPLLWRIHSLQLTRHAAFVGLLAGLFFFALGFHWLYNATRGGYVVCCGILSLYWMLAAAGVHRLKRVGPVTYVLSAAAIWTGTEFLRGTILGGFPWLNIGHTQSPIVLMCQVADLTGVAGITAWVVILNAGLARLLVDPLRWTGALGVMLLATLLPCAYGIARIGLPAPSAPIVRVALVQSNHIHTPDGERTVTQQDQIDYLLRKSSPIEDVDVIAWPETTMPPLNAEARTEPGLGGATLFSRTLEQLSALARDRDAAIVTGGYFVGRFEGDLGRRKATDIRNSVYLVTPDGALADRYDKIRLVPFAEYLPFQDSRSWFHGLMTRFATASYAAGYRLTPASDRRVFLVDSVRLVTPICFEDTIAPLVRSFFAPRADGAKRADLILNISNDGWFNAAEKALHLQIAVFRSIENRVPTARVSNTGQSAFIDSSGRLQKRLGAFEEGVLVDAVRLDPRLSFYTRFGDVFAWGCLVPSVLVIGMTLRRREARPA